MLVDFFGIKIKQLGPHGLHKGGRCVYLCNHRSWADFFIDVFLTQGLAAPMSRTLVYYVFPFFMSSVLILQGVILFKRNAVHDKEKFNRWLDAKLEASIVPSLLVFPEGTRSTRATSLPLKRGMLHYAHSRGLPVQVIITRGKEEVLSEKKLKAGLWPVLVTSFGPLIKSEGVEFEAFAAEVKKTWDQMWNDVYSSSHSSLPDLVIEDTEVPKYHYPPFMRLSQCLCTALTLVIFSGVVWGSVIAWSKFLSLFGAIPTQLAIVATLAVVVFLSAIASISNSDQAKEVKAL